MTQSIASPRDVVPASDLPATMRALDERGRRLTGLVMSPETWAALSTQPDLGDAERVLYARLPVWVKIDCEGVELIAAAADEVAWI